MSRAKRGPESGADLLTECIEQMRRGEEIDPAAFLARCPTEEREELELAIEGAMALQYAAQVLRPAIDQARERSIRRIRAALRT